jgi:hypothetical protein
VLIWPLHPVEALVRRWQWRVDLQRYYSGFAGFCPQWFIYGIQSDGSQFSRRGNVLHIKPLAEQSTSASNYCGELLGALLSTLTSPHHKVILHCNNRGIITHGDSPLVSLPEKQQQADLIQHIKFLARSVQMRVLWEWVEGHAVECKGWRDCTIPECLSNQADKLVKRALLHPIVGGDAYHTGDFCLRW